MSPKILFNLSGEQETSCQILISRRSQVNQIVFFPSLMYLLFYRYIKFKTVVNFVLRCLDTVFQGPYRYFSIALKVVFSLSDRYKIFTSNWLWIEICENVVLSKIDITMTTINKKTLKLIKTEFCVI